MQNIDIYYASLKQVYDQIVNWPENRTPLYEKIIDGVMGVFGVILVLSVIPVLPAILVGIGSKNEWIIGPLSLSDAKLVTFLIAWSIIFVGSLLIFILIFWINNRVDSLRKEVVGPPQSLSPEQLTFIAFYEAFKELKVYFVSHIEQHINNSYRALTRALRPKIDPRKLLIRREYIEHRSGLEAERTSTFVDHEIYTDMPFYTPSDYLISNYKNIYPGFPYQVEISRSFLQTFEKYAWFQIDANIKATLQALISFSEKIPYRLKEKEDLPAVLDILDNLSKFNYSYLPEHKTYMDPDTIKKLQLEGTTYLRLFSDGVNNLTPYTKPEEKEESKMTLSPTIIQKIKNAYYSNVFIRFIIWFFLILVLTFGAILIINNEVSLSPDTIVTVVIPTSVLGAAALAVFLPRNNKVREVYRKHK
jgi:hypothetical protein